MKLLILLAGLLITFPAISQKLYKDYSFYPQEAGTLYFIFPQKGFTSKDPSASKSLEYDITYFTGQDSVSFTYTYINQQVCPTDSLSFIAPDKTVLYTGKATMLFVEPKKRNWRQRAVVKIPHALFISLYQAEEPFGIHLHTHPKQIEYWIGTSKWKKQTFVVSRIFEMIRYNKQ